VTRDAGVNARLRDGSIIWFFGDTGQFGLDGRITHFEIGSAAWAPTDHPTETHDYLAANGAPLEFAKPTSAFPPCPPDAPVAGMWPASAVVQHRATTDRVVLWMMNECLGDGGTSHQFGMSVGEWVYDPTHPPDNQRVEVTVLEQVLFPTGGLGAASLLDGDTAYVYGCDVPARNGFQEEYGPCRAARVPIDHVEDAGAYEMWDGVAWSHGATPAALAMEEGGQPASPPVGPFTVTRDARSGAYVMVYSPWPAYTDRVEIRVAAEPSGPWSVPSGVHVPGCHPRGFKMTWCYGAGAQPNFGADGRLGLGYQNMETTTGLRSGRFLVTSVPFTVG
jgi:hypothetical protein